MRTAALNGAHVEYLRGVRNPIAIKVGPSVTPDQLLRLAERGIPRVLVSRDGPVRARWDGQTAMVSCYASNALYQAVQRVLPTPAPSLTARTAIG
ncbi:hypothetical protein G6F61_014961 [Rhizopus arrhizus]|nr:hypothetical protein G6F61_014961 [Rhizopus arrhizus]